ncbi:hypothetical protein [Prescottella equi]|uniref:Uncharacterized protein n=2 Tax=Rhodococcus hoagii TaxID=43767 RepID=E9SYU0_RHOHA|nr:hypothetical protein [Prescottella equi]GBF16096.1 hypothetical protein Br6_03489 [Rhodococcus sp. Br-6]AVP69907.1 hypothetical protein C7H75_19530 [Prescottella equi]EGD25038.1 hypothetical protein HMPREF0724_11573 [Prescottella equi ATCC 33707]ERN44650.1 hypothetical protein H849_19160 [Prescottella equi NBRC 101255 = C 7]MBM4599651.1 hypothetical protein [Prescottella equi]
MIERSPRPVSVAYWIWVLCAAVMVLLGLLAATTSADAIRGRLDSDVDSFVWLLRGIGIGSVVFGVAIGFLAAPVRAGDRRLRTVVAVLCGVFALAVVAMVAIGVVAPVLLTIPVLLTVATVLVYREGAREWFEHSA